jgi:dTDP-4-amino-4,6-dideoxygalactose transaminase
MDISSSVRHDARTTIFETYPVEGLNWRMTDLQAAVGRKQLERLEYIIERRRVLADRYHDLLVDTRGLRLPSEPPWAQTNWQSYCVRLPDHLEQRAVMEALLERGIATRRGVMCAHREPPYTGVPHGSLLHSEEAQNRCIMLPLYPQMTEQEQIQVALAVKRVCER